MHNISVYEDSPICTCQKLSILSSFHGGDALRSEDFAAGEREGDRLLLKLCPRSFASPGDADFDRLLEMRCGERDCGDLERERE